MASGFITTGDGRFCCRLSEYRYHRPVLNNGLLGNQLVVALTGGSEPWIPYRTEQEVLDAAQRLTDSIALAKAQEEEVR